MSKIVQFYDDFVLYHYTLDQIFNLLISILSSEVVNVI